MDVLKKYIPYLIVFIIGFFLGRSTVNTRTEIKYIKGKESSGSIQPAKLTPYKETIPEFSFLPYRFIFINGNQTQVVDTAAIISDYEKIREYTLTAFDDKEKGKLELFPAIQYNALQSLDWKYTPTTKVITRVKKPVLQPFLSTSWSTLNYIGLGGGIFYHNIGLEYQYLKGYNGMGNGHLIGMKWKF